MYRKGPPRAPERSPLREMALTSAASLVAIASGELAVAASPARYSRIICSIGTALASSLAVGASEKSGQQSMKRGALEV